MNEKPNVYVVEDDPEIRSLLQGYLTREGFRVSVADGAAAMDALLLSKGEPDVIILDVMMPGEDGLSVCRRLRASSSVGILMLTARGEDIDRIVGLEIGADDYLPKPFNPRELLARLRSILRRRQPEPVKDALIEREGIAVDKDARQASVSGVLLDLTTAEFDLLCCFMERPGRVLSRDQLLDWTRGRNFDPFDRTIDVSISRLRKKLSAAGMNNAISTIRGAGYVFTRKPGG